MFLFNLLTNDTGSTGGSNWTTYLVFGLIIVAIIGFSIYNSKQQKKQAQKEEDTRNSLCKGAKLITRGGIIGKVYSVDHENGTFVLETEKSKIKFDLRAILQVTEMPEPKKKKVEKVEEVEETREVEESVSNTEETEIQENKEA